MQIFYTFPGQNARDGVFFMAKLTKRADGRYQRKLTLSDGTHKIVYGKTIAALKAAEDAVRDADRQGVSDNHDLVGEWAKTWVETYKGSLKQSTVHMYKGAYNCHILPEIGGMEVSTVRPVHIQQLMQRVSDKSESLQNKVLLTCRQIFSSAVDNHLILRNPCDGVKIIKHNKPATKKDLTDDEQQLLLTHLNGRPLVFCALGLYAGLRREEILGLQWGDIDNSKLTVSRAITFPDCNQADPDQSLKSKAAHRTVPVIPQLSAILDSAERISLYIVPAADGGMISFMSYRRMWESVTRLIPGVHAHMLRHSYATSLYRAGVDLKTAQYLLGHSDIRMTAEVYTHIAEQDVAKSTSRISEYFGKRDKNEESKKISEV